MHENILRSVCVEAGAPLSAAIAAIDEGGVGIAFIVSAEKSVLGSLTDGDVRRALLSGHTLSTSVDVAMNTSPITAGINTTIKECQEVMQEYGIRQIPRVGEDGRLIDLVLLDDPLETGFLENEVIIMAGGLGTRLRPLTENIPKPMLDVGGKPILQSIVENLRAQGLYKFTFCVNYLSEVIIDHFGDGSSLDVEIKYVHEDRRMGTGGALSLIETKPSHPFIVMNGDIVTKLDFRRLQEFHFESKAWAAVALNEYTTTIPFGVLELSDGLITHMTEKPSHTVFVNAGIYMLSPDVFKYIEPDKAFDMPELVQALLDDRHDVAGFPVFESWLDVGRHNDLDKARGSK